MGTTVISSADIRVRGRSWDCRLQALSRSLRMRATLLLLVLSWSTCALSQTALRFDITAFTVEGNTLIAQQEVDARLAPYAGVQREFDDIRRAAQALQSAYLERGYEAVRVLIPEQDIRTGRVRLQVVEARMREIRIEGNRHFDDANIRASLPALREGEAPNIRDIGANVTLANENPIRQEHVAFQAAPEAGKIDAVVRVTDDEPKRIGVFFDNSGNSSTGHTRAGIGFLHANVGGADHVLNLQFITSPTEHEGVLIFGAGYRIPLYRYNALIDVYGGWSDVDSGTLQNLFNVSGSGTIAGARLTKALPRLGAYEHKAALGLEWKAFQNDVVLIGTSGTLVPDVTTIPLLLSYTGRHQVPGSEFGFFLSYAVNNPHSEGEASAQAIDAARAGAEANFTILRFGAAYTLALPRDDILRIALDGQYTSDALVPGEQFGLGGLNSVRGFYERQTAYDTGFRLSLEIHGPEFGTQISADWRARILAFIDVGRGKDQAPARVEADGLASVGVGGRFSRGRRLSMRFDTALVTNGAAGREKGELRTHYGVAYLF
jgi:hemolysin activation/secretion protein